MFSQEHYLQAPGLQKMLTDLGAIGPRTLHDSRGAEHHMPDVLDLRICEPAAWAELEAFLKEQGVINFAEINEQGGYGVRRDLTEQEVEELPYWPVCFNETGDEMLWVQYGGDATCGSQPARFVSKRFPEQEFLYEECWEDQSSGVHKLKNGVFTPAET